MKIFSLQNKRGFTVLLAVVVSALVLAIGLSIANITLKQILLSSSGRDSQIAFYAADSGSECALYYDLAYSPSKFPDPGGAPFDDTGVVCGDANVVTSLNFVDSDISTSIFNIEYGGGSYCSTVTVTKEDSNGDSVVETVIDSRGYNTCNTGSSRRLERGIQIDY